MYFSKRNLYAMKLFNYLFSSWCSICLNVATPQMKENPDTRVFKVIKRRIENLITIFIVGRDNKLFGFLEFSTEWKNVERFEILRSTDFDINCASSSTGKEEDCSFVGCI